MNTLLKFSKAGEGRCAAGATGSPRLSLPSHLIRNDAGTLAPTRMPAKRNSCAVSNTKDVPWTQ